MFFVTFTADRITEESASEGMAADGGFVNIEVDRFNILEDFDSVIEHGFDSFPELLEFIEEQIGDTEGDSSRSLYAIDPQRMNYDDGVTYMFAAHIEVR